jgi:hypothetical protein
MTNTAKTTPELSFGSKLGISVALTKASMPTPKPPCYTEPIPDADVFLVFSALTRLTTSPFKGSKGAPTYFRDVMFSMIRTQLRNLSIEQAQYLNKSTTEVYLDFAKANNFAPVSVDLGNGAQGHWLGDKNAKVTLLYLHGRLTPHSRSDIKTYFCLFS